MRVSLSPRSAAQHWEEHHLSQVFGLGQVGLPLSASDVLSVGENNTDQVSLSRISSEIVK